jgi:superfamily II DNA or RNA helicase
MGYMDMLNMFFKNDQNNSSTGRHYGKKIQWRLKKPAEKVFWRWVSSWARAIRKPSDLGFDDGKFILPELIETQHLIDASTPPPGELFMRPAMGLKEQREELKATIKERCEKVAELVDHKEPFLIWCHLNEEGDLLEKMIPNAVQVAGKHSDDEKERRLDSFSNGDVQGMITKSKIAGFGMNWQHCAHMTFFPSNSYEQYYQSVRRCWRFGQSKPVKVDMVTTHGMETILNNLQNKSKAADKMFSILVENMNDSLKINTDVNFDKKIIVPKWL